MNKIIVRVRNNIKDLRFEKRLTQEELAKRATCTRTTISKIEQGERNPSIELAYLIAKAFGEPMEKVFVIDEEYIKEKEVS